MQISERHEGAILVLELEGRLDHAGAGVFQEHALRKITGGVRSLIVDFAGTSFVASMGIRALMVPAQEISRAGGRMAIVRLSPEVTRLFEVAGLLQVFQVYPTAAEAAGDGVWL